MANRTFDQSFATLQKSCVMLEGSFVIDSSVSGKTKSLKGSGIKAATYMAAGIYKIQLTDPYYRFLSFDASVQCPVTGSTQVTAISPATVYVIASLGTTTQAQWVTAGVPSGVTAAVGLPFLCAATSSGTGTCSTPVTSKAATVELVGNPQLSINNVTDPHFFIQTMSATAAGDTTQIATSPTDLSVVYFNLMLRNSSVKGSGE